MVDYERLQQAYEMFQKSQVNYNDAVDNHMDRPTVWTLAEIGAANLERLYTGIFFFHYVAPLLWLVFTFIVTAFLLWWANGWGNNKLWPAMVRLVTMKGSVGDMFRTFWGWFLIFFLAIKANVLGGILLKIYVP